MRWLAAAALMTFAAPAGAVAPPLTGNWEGTGSRGVAMSFRLSRAGHRIDLTGGLTVTLPTLPVLCPAGPLAAAAVFYPRAGYSGPGSPPLSVFHFKPRDVDIQVLGPNQFGDWSGTLRNRRTMVLTTAGVTRQPAHCGWPRRLRLVVRHAPRVDVTAGSWTGAFDGPEVMGSVRLHVTAGGHIVDAFTAQASCTGGGPGPGGVGTTGAEEFIDSQGRFAGPLGRNVVNGVATGWQGRFAGDTLTGAVTMYDQCARPPGGALVAAFVAHPSTG
jgi:hypothetical protein